MAAKTVIETVPKGSYGKAIGGSIVSFGAGKDRWSIGAFSKEMTNFGVGLGALKNTIYHYVPSGGKAGAGRLSAGMAQAGKLWVRGGIHKRSLRSVRYEGPKFNESNSELYEDWKQKVGFGDLVLNLTGSMGGAFGVRRSSHGGFELGILEDRYTNSPIVGRLGPGHKDSPPVYGIEYSKKKTRIADYAIAHEFGTEDLPARPLITGLIAGYLHMVDPAWAELFKEMMYKAYWETDTEFAGQVSLSDTGAQVGGGAISNTETGAAAQIKQAMYNLGDSTTAAALTLDEVDILLQRTSDKMPQNLGGMKQNLLDADVIRIVAKILQSKTSMTMEEIKTVAHSVIYGTYEDLNPQYKKGK